MFKEVDSKSFKIPSLHLGSTQEPAQADMGWIYTPSIRLRASNRQVTGNDLVLVQALASQNSQTLEDLQILRTSNSPQGPARQRHDCRNAADPLLDRLNARLDAWMRSPFRLMARWAGRTAERHTAQARSSIAILSPTDSKPKQACIRPVTSALRIGPAVSSMDENTESIFAKRRAA